MVQKEIWSLLKFPGQKNARRAYAVSSLGRIRSFRQRETPENGKLLQGSITSGYRILNLCHLEICCVLYIHREMAKLFLKKPSSRHRFVIHLNHQKLDNRVKNLKWVTADEMHAHAQRSPAKIAYKKAQANRTKGLKLTAAQVKNIKKVLANKNRSITIKELAAKYDVSTMTIYRIKGGSNWSHVQLK